MDFETGLRAQVDAMPPSFQKRRLTHLLDLPADNHRRQTAMLRMEEAGRKNLGVADDAEVNWTPGASYTTVSGKVGTIDWQAIFAALAPIIAMLIKMLFGV